MIPPSGIPDALAELERELRTRDFLAEVAAREASAA